MAEPIYVSTRVGFGTSTYFTFTAGVLSLTATDIVPSSYSMVEPNVLSSSSGRTRYWKYVATADGSVRLDPLLSMPGINSHLNSYVRLTAFKWEQTGPATDVTTQLSFHLDSGSTTTQLFWGPFDSSREFGSGSILVEEGSSYFFELRVVGNVASPWGPVLRMSALRPAEPTWYQPPDRVITTYIPNDDSGWSNTSPLNPWDEELGWRDGLWNFLTSGAGSFQWNRSFAGFDPVYDIGTELAVVIPWLHTLAGISQGFYAAPDFDGSERGVPPPPPWADRQWGAGRFGAVYSRWTYSEGGLPIQPLMSSEFEAEHVYQGFSLHWERWHVGPRVGYTDAELAAIAGVSLGDIVGFVLEDELPEILSVQVTMDAYGPVGDNSATVQWWVGLSRFLSDLMTESGEEFPLPDGLSYGPVFGVSVASGADPPFQFVDVAGVIEGGEDAKPHDYIAETNMIHLGDYTSGLPVYDVPEAIWQAALDVEDAMVEADSFYGYLPGDTLDSVRPVGMTFLAGLSEHLAESPMGPGLPVPVLHTEESKGFDRVRVWPKINFRPSRFKVAMAPDIEIPLLVITGADPETRQRFEPIPPP